MSGSWIYSYEEISSEIGFWILNGFVGENKIWSVIFLDFWSGFFSSWGCESVICAWGIWILTCKRKKTYFGYTKIYLNKLKC